MADVLNLNNEVVKMRKDVKKTRALVIRKLTRQISALKKKKGKAEELEKNQRRAARLVDEINQMKSLKPDYITKVALQKELNFERTCKDPKSSLLERATARIATHPHVSKRVSSLKAAVKAFKEERRRPGGAKRSVALLNPDEGATELNGLMRRKSSDEDEAGEKTGKGQTVGEEPANTLSSAAGMESPSRGHLGSSQGNEELGQTEEIPEPVSNQDKSPAANIGLTTDKTGQGPPGLSKTQAAMEKASREETKKAVSEEESDVDLPKEDEEREYFDDSTEERFHNQSSDSENSDDDDDFFLGKVSKFKRRKQHLGSGETKKGVAAVEMKVGSKQDRRESTVMKLQTVFFQSLSSRAGASVRGTKGASTAPAKEKPRVTSDAKPMQPASSVSRSNGDQRGSHRSWQKNPHPVKQGRGDSGRVPHLSQNAQQALHPSWEASKRRKQQQAQITAFQGKKIKFDDDDDE